VWARLHSTTAGRQQGGHGATGVGYLYMFGGGGGGGWCPRGGRRPRASYGRWIDCAAPELELASRFFRAMGFGRQFSSGRLLAVVRIYSRFRGSRADAMGPFTIYTLMAYIWFALPRLRRASNAGRIGRHSRRVRLHRFDGRDRVVI